MAVIIKPVERVWCTCSMKMETAVLIFATLNCAISGLSGLVGFAGVFVHMLFDLEHVDLKLFGLAVGGTVYLIFAFCFGVLLMKGVLEKKPHYVKIYLIYGVITNIVYLATSVLLHRLASAEVHQVYIIVACLIAGVCIVYPAILCLIWRTYKKLAREHPSDQQYLIQNKILALSRNCTPSK